MEERLQMYNIFWTKNAADFISPILESSHKVLLRKVKIELEFFDYFYF